MRAVGVRNEGSDWVTVCVFYDVIITKNEDNGISLTCVMFGIDT